VNIQDALDEALDICGGKTGPDATDYFLAKLLGAALEGEDDWPARFTIDAEREKAQRMLKNRARQRSTVLVAHNGAILTKPARGGIRSHDGDAAAFFQQTLFVEMTWHQVLDWASMVEAMAEGVAVQVTIGRRLLQLLDAVPESEGPADAAAQLGTTVADWLAS